MSDQLFAEYINTIHGLTGISIRPTRKTMLEGRLNKRLRALKLDSFEQYIRFLSENKDEHEQLVNAITTNETYFYRTPRIWEFISDSYLSDWYAAHKSKSFSVWSAASSTGEEAHTLGIVLQAFKENNPGFNYQITGTDIDTNVLKIANNGQYNGRSVQKFRQQMPELFNRYMNGNDDIGFQVCPDIKSNIKFKHLNLFKPGAINEKYSLILLRNVLIYFSKQDQEDIINMIDKRLSDEGIIIIGESESLNNMSTQFISLAPTIYRREDTPYVVKAA